MRFCTLSLAVFFTFLTTTASGYDLSDTRAHALETVDVTHLSQDPIWLKLLHFDGAERESEILSSEFFLSSEGRHDPTAELEATLRAYFEPFGDDADEHARCRFPARYFWLSQHISLPNYNPREPACKRLREWAPIEQLRSVSLLLVSGYFGNPASAFGHSLLKFNMDGTRSSSTLLDLSFNFGALVPENELTAVYIYKGLSGGYQAGFSDSKYYSQDLVYARTEFRDIWDYELALTEDAKILLVFHLWEIVGKKFTYYFLSKNCAYRLGELIELATGEPFFDGVTAWYAPVELFHRLHALDATEPVIRAVRFIPSSQRRLYHQFSTLTPDEAEAANSIIAENAESIDALIQPFDLQQRIRILGALLAFYEYRITAEEPEVSPDLREKKDRVLLARLQLPVRKEHPAAVPNVKSPGLGSAPMLTAVGVGRLETGRGFAQFRWAPFHYDLVGFNGLENGELIALDVAVGLDQEGELFLDQFDLIKVRKLNTSDVQIPGESRLSWQVQIGAKRNIGQDRDDTDVFANFGVGHARSLFGLTAYGELNGIVQTGQAHLAADPNIGFIVAQGRWKTWVRGGARYEFSPNRWVGHAAADTRYQLTRDKALRLSVTHDGKARMLLSLNRYW